MRKPGETDAELSDRILHEETGKLYRGVLRRFLRKLGIKSARGLSVNFAGMGIRVPGVYTNVKSSKI